MSDNVTESKVRLRVYIQEAFEYRKCLLEQRRKELEEKTRALADEIKQLEMKQGRLVENLGRANEQDVLSYNFLFFGRELA